MDPSKPTDPQVDPSASIPRSRSSEDPSEALVGEVIPKGVPIGRRTTHTDQRGPAPAPGLYDTPLSPGRQAQEAGQPRPKGRLRRAFVVIAALAVGFCLAGVTVAYILYDKATTPDRSSPSVALTQYIDAKFTTRDGSKLKNFECASPSLDEVDQLYASLRGREEQFNITIQVSASDYNVVTSADKSTIGATLKIAVPEESGQLSRSFQEWQFTLVDADGWRVCGAHRTK